jgi:hypothetical protein
VRPVLVEMLFVCGQHRAGVSLVVDQHAVGAFGPDAADEPLGVTVRPWSARRGPDHVDTFRCEHRVERCGKLRGGRKPCPCWSCGVFVLVEDACGVRKANCFEAPAGAMYLGSYHRAARRAADAITTPGTRVIILSYAGADVSERRRGYVCDKGRMLVTFCAPDRRPQRGRWPRVGTVCGSFPAPTAMPFTRRSCSRARRHPGCAARWSRSPSSAATPSNAVRAAASPTTPRGGRA